jgi:hypothetical protein
MPARCNLVTGLSVETFFSREPPLDQAARTLERKRSTPARNVAAWPLSCSAENNTLLAAAPVLSAD